MERWRISSIEPNLLTNEIIQFVANSKTLQPHFHIPLQSGSDRILKFMRRKYVTKLYRQRVEAIKTLMPHACIGVDVIVGFPGETEEDFLQTYHFLQALDISYLHVFTYSERANTRALEIGGIVPMVARKERNERLRILSEKKRHAFYQSQLGTSRAVLWEAENDMGLMYGFTDNYVKVATPFDASKINTIEYVTMQELRGAYVRIEQPLAIANSSN